jgi:hypothetical protein
MYCFGFEIISNVRKSNLNNIDEGGSLTTGSV